MNRNSYPSDMPVAPAQPSPQDSWRIANIRKSLEDTKDRLNRLAGACADSAGLLASGPNIVSQEELDRRELAALRLLYSIENDESPDTI